MSWSTFMTLLDMEARENDPEYVPPPEVDVWSTAPPNHRGSGSGTSDTQPAEAATAGDNKPIEKTISCVSCRKRKLKCDRIKPKCGTCNRLRQNCEYPERRRNLGSKRRNMKELEARLAQVETQLVSEKSKAATSQVTTSVSMEDDWNNLTLAMNIDVVNEGLLDGTFDMNASGFDIPLDPTIPMGDIFSQELLELGLQEPLPPQEMMDELHQIYFEKFHPQIPFMHKYRYYTSLSKSPKFRPPVCLRYAMWAMAASISEKYRCYEDLLYERARRYIQDAEMKGHGETFVSVYYAQAWGLISNFEAKKTYFSRSWMSTGRMVRLVQMLGLYRLDIGNGEFKQILPPARDWIELEERRRTFWGAYYGDRWASSGTGWPMLIHEDEIQTNLPSSEDAFEQGIPQQTISLAEALTPDGAQTLSPFGGVILSATLFGHNFVHLHKTGPEERPEDIANGEYWKRHRKMDNVLSNTFMFLPDHLRLPEHARDMNVAFLHMNIHASSISLHQAAILTAQAQGHESRVVEQSRTRCLLGAEEITNIMRLICHVDKAEMHAWIGFCLYVAAGVFIKDHKFSNSKPDVLTNLEFLISAMKSIGTKHSVTNHFTAQLELDMMAAGIGQPSLQPSVEAQEIPSLPMSGIDPDRRGMPMTFANLQNFVGPKASSNSGQPPSMLNRGGSTSSPHSGTSPDVPSEPSTTWDTGAKLLNKESPLGSLIPNTGSSSFFEQNISQYSAPENIFSMDGSTPGHTMQFPIRGSTPATHQSPPGLSAAWSATGAVVGSGLEPPLASPNDVMKMRLKGSNGWSLLNKDSGSSQSACPGAADAEAWKQYCGYTSNENQG